MRTSADFLGEARNITNKSRWRADSQKTTMA